MGSGLKLSTFISDNLESLSGLWLEAIIGTYHEESASFIKNREDRIANPMGYAIREMVDTVLRCLAQGCDEREIDSVMFPVIQMRAVQGYSPSEAVSFVRLLREVFFKLVHEKGEGHEILLEIDDVIIGLMARAFDAFTGCREKLSEIKQEEFKRNLYMILRKSDMVELGGSE